MESPFYNHGLSIQRLVKGGVLKLYCVPNEWIVKTPLSSMSDNHN